MVSVLYRPMRDQRERIDVWPRVRGVIRGQSCRLRPAVSGHDDGLPIRIGWRDGGMYGCYKCLPAGPPALHAIGTISRPGDGLAPGIAPHKVTAMAGGGESAGFPSRRLNHGKQNAKPDTITVSSRAVMRGSSGRGHKPRRRMRTAVDRKSTRLNSSHLGI